MKDFEIICGDALTVLRSMESESVQMCVTSPPYFGLRDYGQDKQIGLEETPFDYIDALVAVFEQVRRVLRLDGTCWLNLGDSYSSHKDCKSISQTLAAGTNSEVAHVIDKGKSRTRDSRMLKNNGFKNKELIGIPWRVAFALQSAGWYLRQDIIWNKPNPMPESVTDRCTKSHEYIFLLTKSARYYYDNEAIKTPILDSSVARLIQDVENQNGSDRVPGKTNGNMKAVAGRDRSLPRNRNDITGSLDRTPHTKALNRMAGISDPEYLSANKKSVWTVTTQPFKAAHFATFPEKLIEPCILAGSKEGDTVLDPFSGAGTTGLVSLKHKRKFLGIELNPAYIEIAKKRLAEIQVNLF